MSDKYKKIKDDIEKTGFLTELLVLAKFLENGWDTVGNQIYTDLDSQKGREIDVFAEKQISSPDEEGNIIIRLNLIIEIKKVTKNHWVIFTTPNQKEEHIGWNMLYGGSNLEESKLEFVYGKYVNLPIFPLDFLTEDKYFKQGKRFGRSFHEAFKTPQETSKVYTSLLGACKASWHEYLKYGKDHYFEKKEWDDEMTVNLDIIIPLIILEGELYEYYLDENLERQLEEVDFVPVHFKYSSMNYKGKFDSDIDFYPLIIRFDYLGTFIKDMEEWVNSLLIKATEELKEKRIKKQKYK